MLGWRSDVPTVLAASDAMVLTSDNEGTPLSLIQAGMAGLPVVATDVGAVRDVVRDDVTGLVVPPSATGVAEGMTRLLADPALAQRLGDQARSWTRETFGSSAMARHHARLYAGLARQRGVQPAG
jgi:glycosyltransferase involved in cell wall biosynthesis